MLSIIIPTLNEEKNLSLLFGSIRKQNISNYEIVVADAGSSDKTREVARVNNCIVVQGGLPARGRNNGAEFSNGELLLFLDADVVLHNDFIRRSLKEFERRNLQIASFSLIPKERNKWNRFLFNFFYNIPIIASEKILAHAAVGILVDKDFFQKLNGFDETIKIAEDHDLARRADKIGRFGILRNAKIYVSTRRFGQDGWIRTPLKFVLCQMYMIFIGPVRTDLFKYRFNHYSRNQRQR
tara:strand:- start:316 stop:1032 length:717 start_codon:yes stop_codon:yes gene_type:complete